MPRCFILNRVSTEKQAGNLSISLQRELHPRIADQLGCIYSKQDIFDLDVSSTTYDKDKWDDIKNAVASGRYANGYGIFGAIDRYHRDIGEWFEFLTHCIKQKITVVIPDVSYSVPKGQHVPTLEYDPQKNLIQLVSEIQEAEGFRTKLTAKVKRALSHARASGIDIGATGLPTLGYFWDSKPQVLIGGRAYGKWVINPDQKAVVRLIFTTPVGNIQMARILNEKGLRTALGHTFNTGSVSRIRKRLRYAGKMTNDSLQVIDALNVEPIVSYEEFLAVQKYGKPSKDYRGRGAKYKMIGLVKCGICLENGLKGNMTRKAWLNARPEQVRMYCDSTRYLPKEDRCRAFSRGISADRIFDLVLEDLQSKVADTKLIKKSLDDYRKRIERSNVSSRLEGLRKRTSAIDKKLQNLTKAVAEGYPSGLAIKEMNRLQEEKAGLEEQIQEIGSQKGSVEIPTVKELKLIASKFLGDHLRTLPAEDVNRIMRLFVQSIRYYVDHIEVIYTYFPSCVINTPYLDYRFRESRSVRYKNHPLNKISNHDPVDNVRIVRKGKSRVAKV